MRRVVVESPYAGDVEANVRYALLCIRDSLARGEAPIASHLLYPRVLDDDNPSQRELGIKAGLTWYEVADACVVYTNLGISSGMERGMKEAARCGVPIEKRKLPGHYE